MPEHLVMKSAYHRPRVQTVGEAKGEILEGSAMVCLGQKVISLEATKKVASLKILPFLVFV